MNPDKLDQILERLVKIETILDLHIKASNEHRERKFNFWTQGIVPGLVSLGATIITLAWKHK